MKTWSMLAALLGTAVGGLAVASRKGKSPPPGDEGGGPRNRRQQSDLEKIPRSAVVSHLYKATEVATPPNYPPSSVFAPAAWWPWVKSYLSYAFRPKHKFQTYARFQDGVFELADAAGGEDVRLTIAGDWATGTEESEYVAERMKELDPHFTIHLGDVYYVGDPPEVNENCLGIRNPDNEYAPVTWPLGSRGSFALNGNHEMYANGDGYFDLLLPKLGMIENGVSSGQKASFFCLQNRHWRIFGVDTGYYSVGVPVLEHIPLINRIPGVGGDCRLHDDLLAWLKSVLSADSTPRATILLSHHQYYSGFEGNYTKPAEQLWDAGVRSDVLWFWGHEHRLAGYDRFGTGNLKVFGRCLGNGGMPLSLGAPEHEPKPIFYDSRRGMKGYGVNGFMEMLFEGPQLTVNYIDLDGTTVLREFFMNSGGKVEISKPHEVLISDPEFHG